MGRKAKQALLPFSDEQIAVSRPAVVDAGPTVVTQLLSGYACNKKGCESVGGSWEWDSKNGKWRCFDVSQDCHDSGTWDLD